MNKKDLERFIRENNLTVDDVNVYDDLTLTRVELQLVKKQRDKLINDWNELKEFVELREEINPSNHQYKKVLNAIKEIENENTRKEEL